MAGFHRERPINSYMTWLVPPKICRHLSTTTTWISVLHKHRVGQHLGFAFREHKPGVLEVHDGLAKRRVPTKLFRTLALEDVDAGDAGSIGGEGGR
ncbi:hypothetical protein [Arthrobacter alpinus]|uniref:hypothetical protein n=1 Tax=Arthrobacter alpinus TaxID=656366 RepID=UPI0016458016|nr:hypothetical protein [Arthrobacter alpinus]